MEIRIGDENEVKFPYDSNYDLFGSDRLRCVENSGESIVPDCYRKLVSLFTTSLNRLNIQSKAIYNLQLYFFRDMEKPFLCISQPTSSPSFA